MLASLAGDADASSSVLGARQEQVAEDAEQEDPDRRDAEREREERGMEENEARGESSGIRSLVSGEARC